jgi:hypothetical protein
MAGIPQKINMGMNVFTRMKIGKFFGKPVFSGDLVDGCVFGADLYP